MPALITKVEGKGNGIKTVLPNIAEIAQKYLNRNPDYPFKYFGTDLGAQTKVTTGKYIITGEHEQAALQKSLFDYITKFVLCKGCRNPETNTFVDEKKRAKIRCEACGKDSSLDMGEKIMNLIVRNEKPLPPCVDESQKKAKKSRKSSTEDKFIEGDASSIETQAAALDAYLAATPAPLPMDLGFKLAALKTDLGLKKKDVAKVFSRTVFFASDSFAQRITVYRTNLKKVISDSTEKYLLCAAEQLALDGDEVGEVFPQAVALMLEVDAVTPVGVLEWHAKLDKTYPERSAAAHALCDDLVKGLK